MELIAQLVHAESGRRVVEVRAFEGSHLLGSALGEATDAEGAEDRARQRLLSRLAQSALSETAVSDAASLVEPAGVLDPGEGYPAVVSPGALFPVLKTAAVPPPRAMGAESRSRPQALAEPVAKSPPPPPPPARITNQPALARSGRSAGAIEAGGDHAAGSAPQDEARLAAAVAQADGGARSGEANRGAGSGRGQEAEPPVRARHAIGGGPAGVTNQPGGHLPAAGADHPDDALAVTASDRLPLPTAVALPLLAAEPASSRPALDQEPPADPEDWSSDLAALELQLRRLGWNRQQEAIYLQRAFGHPNRNRLTNYSDLRAYLAVLEGLAAGSEASTASVPLRRSELLNQCQALLAQLGWNADQGRAFLERELQAASRQQLNDHQLLHFNMLLETEMLAATSHQAPVVP